MDAQDRAGRRGHEELGVLAVIRRDERRACDESVGDVIDGDAKSFNGANT